MLNITNENVKMKKVKISASYLENPKETMWFFAYFDDNNNIDFDRDNIGFGSIDWGGTWYNFNLYEHDEARAGLEWLDPSFENSKATIGILGRRLAVGELLRYVDACEHFTYEITSLDFVNE